MNNFEFPMSRRQYYFCLLLATILLLVYFSNSSENSNGIRSMIEYESEKMFDTKAVNKPCYSTLLQFKFTVRTILIDRNALNSLLHDCTYSIASRVRVAVEERDVQNIPYHPLIEIVKMRDDPIKDYFEFADDVKRITPRFKTHVVGSVSMPADISQFLQFWNRSKMLECKNMTISRNAENSERYLPLYSIDNLAAFRDLAFDFGLFPFLFGGTSLGWYRECDIIPHTKDLDLAVESHEYSQSFTNYLLRNHSQIRLVRKLGVPTDGLEMTVVTKLIWIDLFFVYHEGKTSWVGGMDGELIKYKYTYPRLDTFCSADLLNRHFYVACNIEESLAVEYGPEWMKDVPSSNFTWNKSQTNVKKAGQWPESMRKTVYQTYEKYGNEFTVFCMLRRLWRIFYSKFQSNYQIASP